jgi:anti-sigma B factor antagonist
MLRRVDTSKSSSPPGTGGFAIVRRDLDERACVISVDGELDLSTAPRLKWMLVDALEGGFCQVVIDLSNVTFMDSTALAVLVGVNRSLEPGARLAIVCSGEKVLQIFEFSGTEGAFSIYPTLDRALAHARGETAPAG